MPTHAVGIPARWFAAILGNELASDRWPFQEVESLTAARR
ncbi:hypothetical protein Pan216_46940 [Planctomycetes bacterium Pan216]|uniref:Uncharacterized protein n=1 Tax=Kolteria novifilia TaxID=2527975 RepID=A0A518BA71_9BACT|nr:hypothetical protein Pan216_46940 [Planctomycetes bacterium Pan216]